MNIHEFQAKQVLQTFEVPVLAGFVARSGAEAEEAARKLPGPIFVVKAQIHAGGRGAGHFRAGTDHAGGVRVTKSATEARAAADAMINNVLITKQTGPAGRLVRQVYVEAGVDIARELYFSALIDRETGWVTLLASSEGGMDIEDVAARDADKIIRVGVDPASGLGEFHIRRLGYGLGIPFKSMRDFGRLVTAIYQAFIELDCAVIEINPLVVTAADEFVALDAKLTFDDNGLFRHPEIEELRDETEEDPTRARGRAPESQLRRAWMGPSGAWSTVPASPWRPWTSSSSTAGRRRTFSMSAAARPRSGCPRRSRSSCPTPRSARSSSTSSAASCAAT